MTDIETLKAAWEKAIDKGFVPIDNKHVIVTDNRTDIRFGYESWIYDHDFARALWGEEVDWYDTNDDSFMPRWKGHLQEMVVADDPIAYLKDHI